MDAPPLALGPPAEPHAFFEGPRREEAFGGPDGLLLGASFTEAEVARLRELVKAHMLDVAREVSPGAVDELAETELPQFHEVTAYDHARMLSKRARTLPAEAVAEIKAMSFFQAIREAFGDYYFADEEEIGHEQITFRLVRPGRTQDVGSLHCDAWFWEVFGTRLPEGIGRAKVWTPLYVEPELNGLRVAPGSHRKPYRYELAGGGGKAQFIPLFDPAGIGLRQVCCPPGAPVLFNYRTLHVGAFNRGQRSRVSIETTIMYRTDRI
jgi:hypothetical protein